MNDSDFKCLGGMYQPSFEKDRKIRELNLVRCVVGKIISREYFTPSDKRDSEIQALLDEISSMLNRGLDE